MAATRSKRSRDQRILRIRFNRTARALLGVAVVVVFIVIERTGLPGWEARRPVSSSGEPLPARQDTPEQRAADMARYHDVQARVTHVVDGDTLDVAIADGARQTTRIRLWGVNTPETVKPDWPVEHFGPEASAFVKDQALGQTVRLELHPDSTRDAHGRLLAYIILPDGQMLNRVLVEQGYAFADPRYEHPALEEFLGLQDRAHTTRVGLWANPDPDHFPYYLPDALRR